MKTNRSGEVMRVFVVCHGPLVYLERPGELEIVAANVTDHKFVWCSMNDNGIHFADVTAGGTVDLRKVLDRPEVPAGLSRGQIVLLPNRREVNPGRRVVTLRMPRPLAVHSFAPVETEVAYAGIDAVGQPARPNTVHMFEYTCDSVTGLVLPGVPPPTGQGDHFIGLVGGPRTDSGHDAAKDFNEMIRLLSDAQILMVSTSEVSAAEADRPELTGAAIVQAALQFIDEVLIQGGLGSRDCLGAASRIEETLPSEFAAAR